MSFVYLDPKWSPFKYDNSNTVNAIVIHHAASDNFEAIGWTFQVSNTSAHYGVAPGRVQQYVHEYDGAWHCGNWWGNHNAVGIECTNLTLAPNWIVADETIQTLCELMADIAIRNNLYPLKHGRVVNGVGVDGNVFGHKELSATGCPWYLYDKIDEICDRANKIIEGVSEIPDESEDSMREMLVWRGKDHVVLIRAFGNGTFTRKRITGAQMEKIKEAHMAMFNVPIGQMEAKTTAEYETVKSLFMNSK